ncbi:uncharacterized protein LOC130726316 [Lotus japonicus]|uniref:uncharacterized protein LOC130726316 n=1 Tax=Lotus japonicus TaxID=34305 RepID=UPI00258A5FBF|nr:uncharacterized protein LOC130726316 [Lotus japonicus]
MASNNTLHHPPDSPTRPLTPATPRRRKNQNSPIAAIILRLNGTHRRKYSALSSPVNFKQGFQKREASARKLAAGLWKLRFLEVSGGGGADTGDGSFCHSLPKQAKGNNVKGTSRHRQDSEEKFKVRRPVTILRSRDGLRCELETYMPCINFSKEEATKWNPALEDGKFVGDRDSVVTVLLEELLRAQRSINKLKAAQKSSEKNVKHFLRNLEREKVFWKRRVRQKIEAMLDDLKDKLAREKRSRERMEVLNTKLGHELAIANLSAKQFMANYEKEKKERELREEVCNELAMYIGEGEAKLEEIIRDSMRIREEVEEERKMMQMAELWREERVQMKLADAKLFLENKYNQLLQLIAYLEMFLRSRGAELDTRELEEAELIKQVVESVNLQRIVELSYDFSKSDDTFPIYEELTKDNANERRIKLDSHTTLAGPSSKIHIESLEEGLNKNSILHQLSPQSDYDVECLKLSSEPQRGDTYVINVNQERNKSESEAENSPESLNKGTIVNGVYYVSRRQSKWKANPASKQLRSYARPNDETTISSTKSSQHRRQGDRTSTTSHCKGSVEGNSKDNMNPHIARGMKGCIEWPRGIPKANSKVIPLEERVKSQKSQLQHVLKPKPC